MCTGFLTGLSVGLALLVVGNAVFPQADIAQTVAAIAASSDRVVYSGANRAVFYDFYVGERAIGSSEAKRWDT